MCGILFLFFSFSWDAFSSFLFHFFAFCIPTPRYSNEICITGKEYCLSNTFLYYWYDFTREMKILHKRWRFFSILNILSDFAIYISHHDLWPEWLTRGLYLGFLEISKGMDRFSLISFNLPSLSLFSLLFIHSLFPSENLRS